MTPATKAPAKATKPAATKTAAPPSLRKTIALGTVALAMLAGVGVMLWNHARPFVLAQDEYQLTIDKIHLTPQPEWIRSDVRGDALRAGFDKPQSITASDLVERIARTLALHPWIEEVVRVEKSYPANVDVTVRYRKPAGLVRFERGWLAVDAQTVWLPSADFTADDVQRYPRITGIDSSPSGPEGKAWEDKRVEVCAKIAEQLQPLWIALELVEITPILESADEATPRYRYEIVSRGGSRMIWGSPIGQETSDEPTWQTKIEWLTRVATSGQKLEVEGAAQMYDLRESARSPHPHTATKTR